MARFRSNTQGALICDILRYARYEPQVLQVEIHPYLTQEPLVTFAQNLGIAVTGYSSFGPASFVELNMDKNTPTLLEHDVISQIAKGHGKSGFIAQSVPG